MSEALSLRGFHHLTMIAGPPARNLAHYRDALGLRLVKRTVNFDDPASYHLYYGDEAGSPGSLLTFFAWPPAAGGVKGTGEITRIGIQAPRPGFADPDGLEVEITEGPPRILSIEMTVPDRAATVGFLTRLLGFEEQSDGSLVLSDGRVEIIEDSVGERGLQSAGSVHHVAWSVGSDDEQLQWLSRLREKGVDVTPVRDRQYFHSIYFREPGGVLFEIATVPPGFAIDEPSEHLGERLMLPAWMEPDRQRIEAALPPL